MGLFGSKRRDKTASDCVASEIALSSGETVPIKQTVDCIGDNCPRPQLMTKKAIGQVGSGEVIEVRVDNPSSMEALPPMCPEIGATHLDTLSGERCWQVIIRKD